MSDSPLTLGRMLDEAAARHPDMPAIVFKGARTTYAELAARAEAFARGLLALGLGPGDHVVLWMPNSVEWNVVNFAIAKIGAVTVTCNSRYKAVELEYLLRQSDAKALVMMDRFETAGIDYREILRTVVPDVLWQQDRRLISGSARPPADLACPANKAAVIGMSCGYGATGGEMYVRGKAALRFMVRNSGATAVVEGVGDDACEYMTRGTVVILAEDVEDIGWNCAGGMRSGVLYLLNGFKAERDGRLNTASVQIEPLEPEDEPHLHGLIKNYYHLTNSEIAARILINWGFYIRHEFAKVTSIMPRAHVDD